MGVTLHQVQSLVEALRLVTAELLALCLPDTRRMLLLNVVCEADAIRCIS